MMKAIDTQYVGDPRPALARVLPGLPCALSASWHRCPPAYHDRKIDTVYALPAHPLAFLASPADLPGRDPAEHPQVLEPYVAAREDAARPALHTAWRDNNTLAIDGPVSEGRLVAVSMNADPAWHATQDGR